MKKTDTLFIGLMLFSMFFGAGNLIFPPYLGTSSGTSFGRPLPVLSPPESACQFWCFLQSHLLKGAHKLSGPEYIPLFSTLFMVVIYLSIGPFLAIPRNANVAYEMGFKPYLGDSLWINHYFYSCSQPYFSSSFMPFH